ncbi:MAG: signal peptidase II [Burkholderiales bacterium]|nr:signal peptidase II [Burkholderiales bacterium]
MSVDMNIKRWLGISLAVIVLDQLTKLWIVGVFQYGDSLPLLSFFNLVHARNSGAAFSFLAGEGGWQRFFFIGIALAASLLIVHLLRKQAQERGFCFALSLILGGALGNLIDRVRFGYVIDFLDFYYAGYHFPAFNVADSAITVGAALLIWDSLHKNAKASA